MAVTAQEWLREYALLSLRLNHRTTGSTTGAMLVYRGPEAWRDQVGSEEPRPAGRLVDDAEALLAELPFEPGHARYLAAQVRALRAVAERLSGKQVPLSDYARECLGVSARPLPEEVFAAAHDQLDAALPRGPGSLTRRLHDWQAEHSLPPGRLPPFVDRAVGETRRRTNAVVPLPEGEVVECEVVRGAHFRAAGEYRGDLRSTIHINGDVPFNLADLLYVVAHEGHPGHIAEAVLKERFPDQHVRFLLTPAFVVSEGLGLHAEGIAFPGGEAQAWLAEQGVVVGGDLAAIHRAQNALFGVWANAAFLAAEGRPDAELAQYLSHWALLSEEESGAALTSLRAPGMALYVLGYFHGWQLLDPWLASAEREAVVRRLLTEQLLPVDLVGPAPT